MSENRGRGRGRGRGAPRDGGDSNVWRSNPQQQQQQSRPEYQPAPPPSGNAWGAPQTRPQQQQQPALPPTQGGPWGNSQTGQSRSQPQQAAPTPSAWGQPKQQQPPQQQPKQQQQSKPQQQQPEPQPERPQQSERSTQNGDSRPEHRERPTDSARPRRQRFETIVRTKPDNVPTKIGTFGKPVQLEANYFRLVKKPNFDFLCYRVDFSPTVELMSTKRSLLRPHLKDLVLYLFDGTQLFVPVPIQPDPLEVVTKMEDGSPMKVTIRKVGVISMFDAQSLQILNIMYRKLIEKIDFKLVGRNYFNPEQSVKMQDLRLEIWPGYVSSIRQHEQDILLCSDVAHKVMRNETIWDILSRHARQDPSNYRDNFAKEVIGMTVLTDYNNKTYKVSDIEWNQSPSSTFLKGTEQVSYRDYYLKAYGKKITQNNQPILVSTPKQKDIRGGRGNLICLIPELCRATGITDEMRANFNMMRAMSAHTRLEPITRIQKLEGFTTRLTNTKDTKQIMNQCQLDLSNQLVKIPGREFDAQDIMCGGNKAVKAIDGAWTDVFKSSPMFYSVPLDRWCIIYTEQDKQRAEEFLAKIRDVSRKMSFNVGDPMRIPIRSSHIVSYVEAMNKATNSDPKIILVITPNNRADLYSSIKRCASIEKGVPSQVVTMKSVNAPGPRQLSIATKVAIQMNCKIGGAPWAVQVPLTGLMTIGFDVYHDSINKKKSFGAFVASMDLKICNRYYSTVTEHTNGEEISNNLMVNLKNALICYRQQHNALPERLIFYRDGVGDGQLEFVHKHEVKQMEESLKEIYGSAGVPCPKMLIIVVSKRINTRIFNNRRNPKPGTVVDDVITLPERYDFFLVSHTERQGTVSPTSYNIIYDTLRLSAGHYQLLTYRFTHLYYNWCGTISVPHVCQYAHKLAFLVGQFLHRPVSPTLNTRLHYL